jgi:hypothetical protein
MKTKTPKTVKLTKTIAVPVDYVKGDKVWVCIDGELESDAVPCPVCEGRGTLSAASGKSVSCCNCHGNGETAGSSWQIVPIAGTVQDVGIFTDEDQSMYSIKSRHLSYCVKYKDGDDIFPSDEIYNTEEAAIKECKKLNKE